MKNIFSKYVKILPFVFTACLFIGCQGLQVILGVAEVAAGAITKTDNEAIQLAKEAQSLDEYLKTDYSFFGNSAVDRLSRRTSSLEGENVNVSPFIFNGLSFVVIGNTALFRRPEINYRHSNKNSSLYEFDIVVSFNMDEMEHTVNLTTATVLASKSWAKKFIKNNIGEYISQRLNVPQNEIKKLKVKFIDSRKGKAKYKFYTANIFIEDTEQREPHLSGYQFDVEVQYQSTSRRRPQADDFGIFNNVYTSKFKTLAAAVIDVQSTIWNDARSSGARNGILPIINFVKVVKE